MSHLVVCCYGVTSFVDNDKKIVSQYYRSFLVMGRCFKEYEKIDIVGISGLIDRTIRQEEARKNRLK
ncbi:protein of unknown function [Petrocella atlantisensis]|uniref:Uncharacterized protein n=1 Tax=Petrocella atlantisensis TaxID=2173034 RepID=A0A3P7S4I2_9FIRM|nr:protein of unknown function [Petrocella atlantisensis]